MVCLMIVQREREGGGEGEREREREREKHRRERETSIGGQTHNLGASPEGESNLQPFGSNQLSHRVRVQTFFTSRGEYTLKYDRKCNTVNT